MKCSPVLCLVFWSILTTTLAVHRAPSRDPSSYYSSSGDQDLFCALHTGDFVSDPVFPKTGLDLCFDDEGNYMENVCDIDTVKKLGLGWYDRVDSSVRGDISAKDFQASYGLGMDGLKTLREMCGKARTKVAEYYGEELPESQEELEMPEMFGDMILTEEECMSIIEDMEGDTTKTRAIVRKEERLWPKIEGVYPNQRAVYFDFTDDWFEPVVEIERLENIYRTMRRYERLTCYRFFHKSQFELRDSGAEDPGHVLFTRHPFGCFYRLPVGYGGPSSIKIIGLTLECAMLPFVVEHELAHALGVIHQHERPDRDFYVDVLFDRIFPGFAHNFFKANEGDVGTFGIPYDVSSVMHYFPAAFSKDGRNTFNTVDSRYQRNAHQAFGLRFRDIQLINKRSCLDPFKISTPWGNVSLECEMILAASGGHCYNSGYVNYADCKTCMCPQGLAPPYCDTVAPSTPACAGAGEIEVAIGDHRCCDVRGQLQEAQCSWLLKKGPGTIPIKLWFEDFDLSGAFCYQQYVEIREKGSYGLRAPWYCEDFAPEPMYGDEFLVHFQATMYGTARTGFKMCFSREL